MIREKSHCTFLPLDSRNQESAQIPFSSLVRINSMLTEGTLKYSRFSLSSASFRDRAPEMKLRWCTTQPDRCMVLPSADHRDSYCDIVTLLALTMKLLVTSEMR